MSAAAVATILRPCQAAVDRVRAAATSMMAVLRRRIGGESSDRLVHQIADACDLAVLLFDRHGRITWVSSRMRSLVSDADDGEPLRALKALLDAHQIEQFDRAWLRARATAEPQTLKLSMRSGLFRHDPPFPIEPDRHPASRPDLVHLHVAIQPLVERGVHEGTLLFLRDLANHHQLEAEEGSDLTLTLCSGGVVETVAGPCRRLTGRDPASLRGESLSSLVPMADRSELERAVANAMLGDALAAHRFRLLHAHGERRWVEADIRRRSSVSGEPHDIIVRLRDIHARCLLEETLSECAAKLRETTGALQMAEEMADLASWRFEAGSRDFDYGHGLHAMSGRIPGRSLAWRDLLRQVAPRDRRRLLAALRLAPNRRDAIECEIVVRGADGRHRTVHIAVGALRDEKGGTTGWHGIAGRARVTEDRSIPRSPIRLSGSTEVGEDAEGTRQAGDGALLAASRPLSLLVAEDNPASRRLLVAVLERLGHRVRAVRNGREALDAARATRFDAIVLDLLMPELDGLATTRLIRGGMSENSDVPIIALTADDSHDRRRFARTAGFTCFLAKPVSSQALRDVLEREACDGGVTKDMAAHIDTASSEAPIGPALLDDQRLDQLRTLLGARRFDDLTAMLRAELEQRPALIRAAAAAGDWRALAAEAHQLKGAAGSAGAAAAAHLADRIECEATQGRLATDAFDGLLPTSLATLELLATRTMQLQLRADTQAHDRSARAADLTAATR